MKKEEFESEAKGFFNFYKKKLGESTKGENVVYIDFNELSSFSHKLSDALLENPEDVITRLEINLEELGLIKKPRIRFYDLPDNCFVKIRDIRAKHLGKFIWIEGIVRQASDVRPQVVSAKFECPSCGAIISVLQLEKKFKEPSRCSCGRKGFFKLIAKDMVDAQRLVIEESPESLVGGEQPRRLNIFLKEDLVEPKMEERTTPGSKVLVLGMLNEVPVPLQTGAISTRFDLAIDANNVVPTEETYSELKISDEDEQQIKELSMDPNIFKKLADNIAPSIWGYEEIKKAIVLQLFGGVKKNRSDGTSTRGDVHILLVGDPGVAKSIGADEKILFYDGKKFGYCPVSELYDKFGKYPKNLKTLTIDTKKHESKWCNVSEIIKHLPENDLIEVTTEHGKKILATNDHSFITLDSKGDIVSIKGSELNEDSYLPIPINFHKEIISELDVEKFNTYNTNSKQLPNKISLDESFGFFVGIFLSEGYIRSEKVVSISNKNKLIKKRVKDFAEKIGFDCGDCGKEICINSKSLCNFLKDSCYDLEKLEFKNKKGNYSRIKKIPDFIFFSKRDFVKGVISGLFSGDGRLIKDKKRLKGFELISVSEELVQGTSNLLFSIGIMNRVIKRKYTYKNKITNYYILSVSTPMISKFLKHFNIYGRCLPSFNKSIYSCHDCIPCGDLIYNLTKQLGFNSRLKGDRVFAAEMRTVRKRNKIGRLRLRRILKIFQKKIKGKNPEFEILKKIAYSPIIWSKIKEIKKVKKKKEDVYDLSIPSTNTFVSNGLGVHNSITLGFIAKMAPKGRYVVGKSTSGAGLTATVVKDEFLKGWSLEAGAMVLSNKGIVCIDEIEKMDPQDRSSMHEALEQQTVTISKANVQATLRAETSVLAAGNPKFGRFDPFMPIAQQVDIQPTLLNRFDVIFMLRDLPDKQKDDDIASHMLKEHQTNAAKGTIDKELFKKYVAYAKQKVVPKLSDEAVAEIKNFYVTLRNAPSAEESAVKPIPITARQIGAMIRLAEASAKTRLSDIVEKKDAEIAINILKYYLSQAGYDYDTKSFDIDKITSGITASKRGKIVEVKNAIFALQDKIGKQIPVEELEKYLEGKIEKLDLEEAIEKLSISGDIFQPKKGYIQMV